MKTNILKSFIAMLAIVASVAFVGCKDDDTETPKNYEIAVSVNNLAFTFESDAQSVDVTAEVDWRVENTADWVTVQPMQGTGNRTITISVADNDTGNAREAEVKIWTIHPQYGDYASAKVDISQSADEQTIEPETVIFKDNFDKKIAEKGEYWPYFSEEYANPTGKDDAIANVTYESYNVSARTSNGSSGSDKVHYAGSGGNNLWFNKADGFVTIKGIALSAEQTNYVLNFGAKRDQSVDGQTIDNTFKNDEFLVFVSGDGVKWSAVEYSFDADLDLNGTWNEATASFKFTEVPAALSIKFVAKVASAIRLDDVKLSVGGEGAQTIDLSQGTEDGNEGGGDEPGDDESNWGDDERYLSDEGFLPADGSYDQTNKVSGDQLIIEGQNYPALKLGTSSAVGTWTTAAVGVEGDYTLSFYAFAWNNKPGQLVVAVDGDTVATIDAEQTAGIANNSPYTIEVDQENNHYTVALTDLTEESTITFSTTEGKYRVVLCGIKLAEPAAEPVDIEGLTAKAEGYQGAKISWTAVEGAETYTVSVVDNDDIAAVEVEDATEAVITGLTDARKYTFKVEAYDADDNLVGEGETAETEIWTLCNWEEPEFSLTLSEDKTKYVFKVANLVEMNYAYAGGTIEILKDGELAYTLKNSTQDGTLCDWFDARMNRWPLGSMNNRKDWTWYRGATDEILSQKDNGTGLGEGSSVPASFFTAGEYTLNYTIDYVLGVNTIPCLAKPDYDYEPIESMEGADFLRLPNGRADVLFDEANVPHREVKTNGETPVALATIEPTLEFSSVTAKAEGYQGAKIEWSAVETADAYKVTVNGEEVEANGTDGLSHTIAPETLTDANEYTFTVKAYKGAEAIATGEAKTQVWSLVNTPEPVVTFVDGKLTATNLVDVTGVALKMTVTFTKEGAAEAAYTAYSEHYFNSTSDIRINIDNDQKFKFADFDTFTMWTWNGSTNKDEATDAAQTFEPGTYKVAYTAEYYPVVGGIWKDANKVEVASKELAGANGRITYPAATSVLEVETPYEGTADDVVIADPDAPEPVEMTPAAAAEGYQGAKVTWEAVEGAETYTVSVVGNEDIAAVEPEEGKTEVVFTELKDARAYTFKVEAYDENNYLVGEGTTAETEVWNLAGYEEPTFEVTNADGKVAIIAHNVVNLNYAYAGGTITLKKGGEVAYTLKNTTKESDLTKWAGYGRWKRIEMDDRKDWTWYNAADEQISTDSGSGVGSIDASLLAAGEYTIEWELSYVLSKNASWATFANNTYTMQDHKEDATHVRFPKTVPAHDSSKNYSADVLMVEGVTHKEVKSGTSTATLTIAAPITTELNVKAAIDEGTRNGRALFGSTDTNYTGIASINGMLESVKLSWKAVEADKIVIAYNGQTVEVDGTATQKVIEGLKTSPVEFTVSAVKGSETIAEETVSSDVYVLPEADTSAQWVAKYTESGYQILGTGWNTKQYAVAHVTFNVYEKDSATAVFDKDVNYKGGLGSIIAWAMGNKAPNGVCYAGPGNRACHGGDGNNWDEDNLPTGASVVDGKEVFTGLDPKKEYVVKYTLKVWPYIFDASNANNKEPYQNGSDILMNYFFKSMMIGGTADTYYDAVDLQGEAELTFEGVPEPEIEKLTIAEFLEKKSTSTTYELTGKITKIAKQDTYSNFYISDNTAELLIWGMLDGADKETLKNKGILVGDEVTLQGVYYMHTDGTEEIQNATYISHKVATWPWITAVTPETVSFEATGGNEDVALTLRNGEGVTPSLSGLTAPFSATWDAANSVVKVACEATDAEAEQTLTIAFTDGNSVAVEVKKKAAGAGDAYTMIDRIADLTAGTYYMSAYLTKGSNNADLSATPYHLATGEVNDGDLVTVSTNFEKGDFTSSISTASAIELVAVDGKTNTYHVKIGDKYLNSTSNANRKLELNTSASEWVVKNNSNGGITLTHSNTSVNLGSASATSKFLRSYGNETTLKYGAVFFKEN